MKPKFGRRDSGFGERRPHGYVRASHRPFAVIPPSIASLASFE